MDDFDFIDLEGEPPGGKRTEEEERLFKQALGTLELWCKRPRARDHERGTSTKRPRLLCTPSFAVMMTGPAPAVCSRISLPHRRSQAHDGLPAHQVGQGGQLP